MSKHRPPRSKTGTSTRKAYSAFFAPAPNGNYSHAVLSKSTTLHVAGWMGDDPSTGEIVEGGIGEQTHRALANISFCLKSAGLDMNSIVRRRIYMIDIKQFREVDAIWAEWVEPPFPVSTCVQVGALAKEGALVEIEVDADSEGMSERNR